MCLAPEIPRPSPTALRSELAGALMAIGTPRPDVRPPAPARRAKLWELDDKLHCPVIGTCLDITELQRYARRFQFAAAPNDDFGLHVEAVSLARSRSPFTETLQRHLERKYRATIERFTRLKGDADVLGLWTDSIARGDLAGPLWAASTHKAVSAATRQRIYADIHMLSHQIGAGQAADTRRLSHLEKENAELKSGLKRELAALRRQLAAAEAGLGELQAVRSEAATLQKRLERFESGQVMVEMGRRLLSLQASHDELAIVSRRVWELEHTLKDAHRELARFAAERDTAQAERQALEQLLHASLPAAGDTDALCTKAGSEDCAGCSEATGPRCILYVGGRAALIAQYRQLAARLGIRLIHHDGGLEESLSRLPDMIRGADAVLCPTDRVSHNAYHHVKAHCKRAGTPCLFYKGSGMAGFAAAVARVGRGEYSVAGLDNAE